jgi:hypothetical protein
LLHSRYTPVVDNSRSGSLFWIVGDIRTKAINCSPKVVIGALNDIPVGHEALKGLDDHCEGSVEESTAEVSEGFVVGIFSSTY